MSAHDFTDPVAPVAPVTAVSLPTHDGDMVS